MFEAIISTISPLAPYTAYAFAMFAAIIPGVIMLRNRQKAGLALIVIAILTFLVSISLKVRQDREQSKLVRELSSIGVAVTDMDSTLKMIKAKGLISSGLRPFLKRINRGVKYVKEISEPFGTTELYGIEENEILSKIDRIEEAIYALRKTDMPQLKHFLNEKFDKTEGAIIQSRQMIDHRLANENRLLREQLASSIAQLNSLLQRTGVEIKDYNAKKTAELLKAINKAVFALAEF